MLLHMVQLAKLACNQQNVMPMVDLYWVI
uniref:Uncharacterized protein n=1 Tax=Rhizophora mucronata TaxID=61149 RepID=A0A2P2PH06_RHIMU